MKKVSLVVFDMAGTTIKDEKEVENCFAKACVLSGLEVSEERILALQGYAKREVFTLLWTEIIRNNPEDLLKKIDQSYSLFCKILESHYEYQPIFPTDYCLETFEWLKENNIKIALTTGFYRKVADIILGKLGWLTGLDKEYYNASGNGIIDFSITPTETGLGRPHPEMINKSMHKFGITNSKTVINLGDTPVDLQFGYNANVLLSLGITNGTHTREQLVVEKNDGLLANLSELRSIIENL